VLQRGCMTSLNLDRYRADHLFILVGGNTLPNYVAVQLLAKSGATIYLVYSKDVTTAKGIVLHGTKTQADALEKTLKGYQLQKVPVEESNSDNVQKEISDRLIKISDPSKIIGLHYTGGTKTMSVHTYRAMETQAHRRKDQHFYFSYLDARRLRMWIQGSPVTGLTAVQHVAVGMKLRLSFADLLLLQNLELDEPVRTTPVWQKLSQELLNVYTQVPGDAKEAWSKWWRDERYVGRTRTAEDQEEKLEKKFQRMSLHAMPAHIGLQAVYQALQQESGLTMAHTFHDLVQKPPFASKFPYSDLTRWLEGSWLEDYVAQQLVLIKDMCDLGDIVINIKPKIGSRTFEFDVACMRGYQLFAISCTTSAERRVCKSKLLEAISRARQLGGSEARIGVVCCYDRPADLEAEVANLVSDQQVRVFGLPQLKKRDGKELKEHLADWIFNSGDNV